LVPGLTSVSTFSAAAFRSIDDVHSCPRRIAAPSQ
jgi:hypothetical protein